MEMVNSKGGKMSNYYRAVNEDFGKDTERKMSKINYKGLTPFEIIAKWIHSESTEPISEIEWLLKAKYKSEKELLEDYDDVIKEEI